MGMIFLAIWLLLYGVFYVFNAPYEGGILAVWAVVTAILLLAQR